MGLPQRVIEFLEDNLLAFTPDKVREAAESLGIEGDIEALSREVLEEGVRRSMAAVRGLRETFGELPYPESVLEGHLREGGSFTVTLSNPHFMKSLTGRMELVYEYPGPIESSVFSVEDSDGRFPYNLYFPIRPGLPRVFLPNLAATWGKVFFRDHGRKLERAIENVKALRPLFASLGLSDLEGAMEALAGLKDGEARTEGGYVLARIVDTYALRKESILGDPHLDGAVLLGEEVRLSFPGDVEIALRAGWSLESASLERVRIRLGEEDVWLRGQLSRTSPLHRDPLASELRALLSQGLEGLERKGACSPKMLTFLRAFARHEDPFRALAEGRLFSYATAELFRDF
jgi:hypothetical protein